MPIYEYQAVEPDSACSKCRRTFEVIQGIHENPLEACPNCGRKIRKVISRCHAAVMETPDEHVRVVEQIADYEKAGLWSHAAELADKHAEKTKDSELKTRALEDYRKAGYDLKTLEKYDQPADD